MDNLGFDIVRSKVEGDINTNFVGLANLLFGIESYHAAFVIKQDTELFEFHYTGSEICFDSIKDDYYHKRTTTILPEEVPAFIAFCKNVKKHANPTYGYFYSGESYNNQGIHQSSIDLGERMTCVGFCLNILKGFIEKDYLDYKTWDESTHEDSDYLENYCKKHNLDKSKIQNSHRRICPREYLVSGFFDVLPITKQQIDKEKTRVDELFSRILGF